MEFEVVLALGAHTDDIELGCGGFLSRLRSRGTEVHVVAFSRAEASLPPDMPPDTLERECRSAFQTLGISDQSVAVHRYPVRRLGEHRQDILEQLVSLKRDIRPDLVLTMNSQDTHQDHQVIHAETVRAFRNTTVLGYESPWNQHVSHADLFVELSPDDLDRKILMLGEYRSQQLLGRAYMSPEYIRSAAVFRGMQGGMKYAELFEVNTMKWCV